MILPILVLLETAAGLGALYGSLLKLGGTLEQAFILTLCYVTAFYSNDLYDLGIVRSISDFLSRLPRAILWGLVFLAVAWGLSPDARMTADTLAVTGIVAMAVLLPARATVYAVLRCRPFRERVLILGTGTMARRIGKEIESHPHLRLDLVGFVGDPVEGASGATGLTRLGTTAQIERVILEHAPNRIIVALTGRREAVPVRQLVEMRLNGIDVEGGEEFHERITGKIVLESLSPSSFVFGRRSGMTRLHLAIGRAASIAVSASGLALTAPLFPLIALAIRLDSPGPIFYLQDRIGRHGRSYRMLKFRTMQSVEREGSSWAADNGHRITRVGAWLRR
ncbi:MAG TPA: sugar transferase, partial [Candidatus Polarisedimenticolia bacterium]|nr:sugar transferase [Candidatus Polarisedimenticolia bacterium]